MAETMKLQVITPDKEFFHGDVSMVELNTADGELGVYPQHIPLTTAAAPGVLKIHQDGQVKKAALLSGFLQILPEKMTILAEVCEWPEEIDGARANEARIRAERRLRSTVRRRISPGPRRRLGVRWCGSRWWRSTKNTFSYPGQGALIFL